MTVTQVVNGAVRDVVRAGSLAALHFRGGPDGRMLSSSMVNDPYPTYRYLHTLPPVAEVSRGLFTARHAICDVLLRHPSVVTGTSRRREMVQGSTRFSQWLFSMPDRDHVVDPIGTESMIGVDGRDHARLRKLTSAVFTPAAIGELRPHLTEIAQTLLREARREPRFELMSTFAGELPVRAICLILGVPVEDAQRLRRWGSAIAADFDALASAAAQRAATTALEQLEAYFFQLFDARRRDPGDDMLSKLIMIESEGERLTARELMATCVLLLFAGFETTVNLIGNGTMALLAHPDQHDLLRNDPDLIPTAVEELLRYDSPIQVLARRTTTELKIDGATLPANTNVSLMLGAANRDPLVFDDPDRLDVRRPNARKHLAFAAGPHHCLGAALARLEGEIAFTTMFDQLGSLHLAGKPLRRQTFALRGMRVVPLRSHA